MLIDGQDELMMDVHRSSSQDFPSFDEYETDHDAEVLEATVWQPAFPRTPDAAEALVEGREGASSRKLLPSLGSFPKTSWQQ